MRVGKVIEANTELNIIEHNPYWVVVSKPSPLIVHPTSLKKEPSLWGELKAYFEKWGYSVEKTSILNRLDRETSGLCLVAIHPEASRLFGKIMMQRGFEKSYEAIVCGHPSWREITVNEPLLAKKEVEPSMVWVRQMVHPDGKASETKFRVLKNFETAEGAFSLLEVRPTTGRMHQIRVHCEWLGHPIIGDKIYGKTERHYLEFIERGWNEEMAKELHLRRQALHATGLSVGEGLWSWQDPLPADMAGFLAQSL